MEPTSVASTTVNRLEGRVTPQTDVEGGAHLIVFFCCRCCRQFDRDQGRPASETCQLY